MLAERTTASRRRRLEVEHGRRIAARAQAAWGQAGRAGQLRVERRSELLAAAARVGRGLRTLELGCGNGEYTRRLRRAGLELVCIDISPDLIQLAQRRFDGDGQGLSPAGAVHFVRADAGRLPFADGCFDAVVGNAVLHHLEVNRTLSELWRLLRPGGWLALAEPNMVNPQVLLQKNVPPLKRWLGDTPHETAFTRWGMSRELRAAGFRDVCVEPFDFLHPALPAAIAAAVRRVEPWLERTPLVREISGSLLIIARR